MSIAKAVQQQSKENKHSKLVTVVNFSALQNYQSLQIKSINQQTINKSKSNEQSTKSFSITDTVQLSSRRNKLSINQNHCSIIIKFPSPKRFSNLFKRQIKHPKLTIVASIEISQSRIHNRSTNQPIN